jgi:MFS family permease
MNHQISVAEDRKLDAAQLREPYILPVITLSTFAGTSLWFAGNAVVRDIQKAWVLGDNLVAYVTSSVQVGFIVGTAVFALTGLVDMFPPGRVFLICCLIGAFFNASIYLFAFGLSQLLLLRFLIGFCLAGIYPVALKIAKGWYDVGLGYAMGCVVCALAMGTAFPHLIKACGGQLPWGATLISVSIFAAIGGVCMFIFVPDGPLLKKGAKFNMMMVVEIFREWNYTQASLGYYGHMWEQYSFWGYLPTMIDQFSQVHNIKDVNVPLMTFIAISSGAIGSFVTGWGTKHVTNSFTATFSITGSAICGILHPIFYGYPSLGMYMLLLFVWGWNVTSDSPQFSAMASRACKPELLGTALTVYNCIGYFMTVISIQLCQSLAKYITMQYVSIVIAIGPVLGAYVIWPRAKNEGIWIIPDSWRRSPPSAIASTKDVPDFHESHVEMRSMSPQYDILDENDENGVQPNVSPQVDPKSTQV